MSVIGRSWRSGVMSCDNTPLHFTKEEYLHVVQQKTEEFVHKYFGETITALFNDLRKDAEQRKHCHREIKVEVPDPFDVNKTEDTLRSYFRGLGFEVITEPRKEETPIIVLTLT